MTLIIDRVHKFVLRHDDFNRHQIFGKELHSQYFYRLNLLPLHLSLSFSRLEHLYKNEQSTKPFYLLAGLVTSVNMTLAYG